MKINSTCYLPTTNNLEEFYSRFGGLEIQYTGQFLKQRQKNLARQVLSSVEPSRTSLAKLKYNRAGCSCLGVRNNFLSKIQAVARAQIQILSFALT